MNKEPDYEPDAKIDKIDHEKLNKIYDILTDKLRTIYFKRPTNQYNTLENGREKFIKSEDIYGKMKLINNVINLLRCDATTTADLSFIGGSKNAGSMVKNKNTVCNNKIVLVNQSITGLFENRIEL